jgi:hypothetical protein
MQKSEIVSEIIKKQQKMHTFVRLPNAQTVVLLIRDLNTA